MRNIFLFLLIIQFINQINAQEISGVIVNEFKENIESVDVFLINKKKDTVAYTKSNNEGRFILKFSNEGISDIKFNHISYKEIQQEILLEGIDLNLGEVTLIEELYQLDDVILIGEKKIIESTIDGLKIDIENSKYNEGFDAFKLATLIPGIRTNGENITFEGTESVNVKINGKDPIGVGGVNVLKTIDSSKIEYIEFESVPSAERSAENSETSFNIILKDDFKYGLNGSVNSTYTRHRFNNFLTSTNLGYGFKKLNLQAGYTYLKGENFSDNEEFQLNTSGDGFFQDESYNDVSNLNFFNIGIDYNINENSIFTIDYNLSDFRIDTFGNVLTSVFFNDSDIQTSNDKIINKSNNIFGINYKINNKLKDIVLKTGITKSIVSNATKSDIISFNQDNEGLNRTETSIFNDSEIDLLVFNVDFEKKIDSKSTFRAGVKYSNSQTDNDLLYFDGVGDDREVLLERSNDFIYNEDIIGLYSSFSNEFKKIKYKLGLRSELTDFTGLATINPIEIDRYFDNSFVSFRAQRKIGEKHLIKFSYGQGIARPSFANLNPFEDIEDPFYSNRGNPFLSPSSKTYYTLNYDLNNKYRFKLFYTKKSDVINNVLINEESRIISTYDNTDESNEFGLSLSFSHKITSWYDFDFFGSLKNSLIESGNFNRKKNIIYTQINNNFNFGNHNFQVFAYYLGDSFYDIYDLKEQGAINFSYRTSFFNKKVNLAINFQDVFDLKKIRIIYDTESFIREFDNFLPTRSISFELRYNFSRGKKNINRDTIKKNNKELIERL